MASRFSVPLQALADKIKLDLETVARKSTFDLFSKVSLRSPVDTGRFRANWNVSYGAPNVTVTASTTQARASSEIGKALTLPIGGVTYMANGLPYAYELEKGHSKQAPRGMVEVSAIEFSDYVRKATA
jgi:hypothetical protein